MNNKRGQFFLAGFLALALILLGFFYFSTKFRWLSVGAGVIIMSFVILSKKEWVEDEKMRTSLFIAFFGIGLIAIFSAGVLQSVIGVSQVTFSDGKPYWVYSGSLDSQDQVSFVQSSPSSVTAPDGTTYKPQEPMNIQVFSEKKDCVWVARKDTYKYGILKSVDYWTLDAPKRDVQMRVLMDGGIEEEILTIQNDKAVFSKNGGQAVVKTEGLLVSSSDCESGTGIAVIKGSDGKFRVLKEDAWKTQLSKGLTLNINNVNADGWLTQFDGEPTFQTNNGELNEVRGAVDLGKLVFTITADAEYFDSVIVKPASAIKPSISLDVPDSILKGDSGSIKATITNSGDDGVGLVKAKATTGSISPQSVSIDIAKGETITKVFTIKVPTEGVASGKISVCDSSQSLSSINCDEETYNINIVQKASELTGGSCGDGKCDSFESSSTCQSDCKLIEEDSGISNDLDCNPFETIKESEEKDYKLWNYFGIGEPQVTKVRTCVTASWVYFSGMLVVVIGIGYTIYRINKPKRRR